jgi:hypothetical protein
MNPQSKDLLASSIDDSILEMNRLVYTENWSLGFAKEKGTGGISGINFDSKDYFNHRISIQSSILMKFIFIFMLYFYLNVDLTVEIILEIKIDSKDLRTLPIPKKSSAALQPSTKSMKERIKRQKL